ncbi:MAG: acetyl-coenzyme A synthetase N-terminal domain-containing protein, partial [Paracoccaceae bacterium]
MTQGRDILWSPSVERYQASTMAAFERYLSKKHELTFSDYNDMWRWSISDLNSFWGAISDFFELRFFEQPQKILNKRAMPGAEWFVGAKVNYADQLLSKTDRLAEQVAFVSNSETFGRKELTWNNLKHSVASVAENFKKMGVTKGDRIVAILPNTEVALIGLLATASLGAVWSLCAPDM